MYKENGLVSVGLEDQSCSGRSREVTQFQCCIVLYCTALYCIVGSFASNILPMQFKIKLIEASMNPPKIK